MSLTLKSGNDTMQPHGGCGAMSQLLHGDTRVFIDCIQTDTMGTVNIPTPAQINS